jgi:MFS family permease
MKLWRVAGVLALIGAEALLYGYSYPFFSLALEKHELPTWLIGLNASVAGAGILIVGPVLPGLIARFGVRQIVAAMFAISLVSFGAILAADHLAVWFAARFVMGACFAALWTTTEIWLNGVVDDRHRGRIIGASGTLYATCQFIGPLILGGVGVEGQLPLIVAMVPLGVGVLVALSIRPAEGEVDDEEETGDAHTLRLALSAAGSLVGAAFLGGIGETAMQSLLPLYGLAHGLSDAGAAGLVAVFSLGEAVLVAGLGWMADRYGRRITLLACAIVAALSASALPFVVDNPFLLQPALFLAGGTIAGIYTLGVVLIGQDFRGQRLAVVSTGFAMAYSAGSIVGSTPVGYVIDLFGPEALPFSIAGGFALLALFLLRREKSVDVEQTEPEAATEFVNLPVIEQEAEAGFDLAFLHQVAPLPAGKPAAAAPPLADIRQWHETNLEDRFRQRAAEMAERAAKRYARQT